MNQALGQRWKSGFITVFLLGLICSALVYFVYMATADRIALNRQKATIKMIEEVMPLSHDNNLFEDKIDIPALSTTVYRARQNQARIGLVFLPVSANGYNGEIKLAMGLSYDGTLQGVRIIEHQETTGLGDNIDQNISDWIYGFDSRSLSNTQSHAWAVSNDGGEFDQLSGATISPRGVINAVKNMLDYYQINQDDLYK